MLHYNARKTDQGFTLYEILTVVIIVGILSAIAALSFLSMFNKNKVNNAFSQTKGALQEAQREAIRRSKRCDVHIHKTSKKITGSSVDSCLVTGDRILDSGVGIATKVVSIRFSHKGTITLADAGTIILYNEENPNQNQCLVLSSPLGLIRTGTYEGSITPEENISRDNCKKNEN